MVNNRFLAEKLILVQLTFDLCKLMSFAIYIVNFKKIASILADLLKFVQIS